MEIPNERDVYGRPAIGSTVEYTKVTQESLGDRKWFRCEVIAYDGGEPVIKTEKGHYHRRPTDQFIFRPVDKED